MQHLCRGTVSKVDSVKKQVFGWASVTDVKDTELVDLQGDIISADEMEAAAYDFVLHSRTAGEMHERTGVGKLIESIVLTKEKQAALGIDLGKVGWWIGFQVTDDDVWKKIESGEYRSFSIGGTGVREALSAE